MKYLLYILLFFSTSSVAGPFNIYLPFNSQYTPGVMEKYGKAFLIGVIEKGDNFQLQFLPKTENEQYISDFSDYKFNIPVSFLFSPYENTELEIGSEDEGKYFSVKYDFSPVQSPWKTSVVFGWLNTVKNGHAGALIQEGDDCGFLGLFCFFSSPSPDVYEYNYEADTTGLMLAYLQGYQYSQGVMGYLGVYFVNYDIKYQLIDNAGTNSDQKDSLRTDLIALTVGLKGKIGKSAKEQNDKYVVMNYIFYKDSTQHDGVLDPELRISFVMEF
ncbi:MAG: hypothetical protein KAQ67_00945 [Gammaproteobacteria bacterium]|nr:hypothetical protein [Gammaproteobacteria bacterium]